ncbi:hypothetical protein Bca4012_087826 [Brassica carinata]
MAPKFDTEKMQERQNFRNVWHTDLTHSIQGDTPYCCFALWCSPCASYLLRKRALYNDMSRSFAALEPLWHPLVFFFKMSSRFRRRSVTTASFQVACIFSIVACIVGIDELSEASQLLSCLADMVYCTVCACMQTQHKVEMDKRDGKFGPQPMAVPPPQVMSRIDQATPPAIGYPPQGYPPSGYPQHPPQGYPQHPPQGYPPSGYQQHPPQGYPPSGYPQNPPAYPQYPPGPAYPPQAYPK